MNPAVAPILSELHQRMLTVYGNRLDRLVLFGSHARGDARTDSDIDVLVVLRGDVDVGEEIRRTVPVTADLSLRHNVLIACAYVSSDDYRHAEEPLLRNVRLEGITI